MSEQRVRRRLAAILAADVVGYSRLMGEDEAGTLAALKAHIGELIRPAIADHSGRVFKTMGDGLLAEFASAVDAVACARAIQLGMARRNERARRGRAIVLRIGVNVGDIIVDGDDIYGDGVNVAARLEGIAEPGGVCVSGTVYDQVRGKLGLGFADLGERAVKNIAEPVRAYAVFADRDEADAFLDGREKGGGQRRRLAGIAVLALLVAAAFVWSLQRSGEAPPPEPDVVETPQPDPGADRESVPAARPSLAVIPFSSQSDDPARDDFAEGVGADIAGALAKISGLFVVAPSSTQAFRERAFDAAALGRDLDVAHIVEGSVAEEGGRAVLEARLIVAASGKDAATLRQEGAASQIVALEAALARDIASALGVTPDADEGAILDRVATSSAEAYERYLAGRALLASPQAGINDIEAARAAFREAVALDPAFAGGYAGLAASHTSAVARGLSAASADDVFKAIDFASTAISIDPTFVAARLALGEAQLSAGRLDEAIALGERTIEIEPSNAAALSQLGLALVYSGRHDEAIGLLRRAVRLDPANEAAPWRDRLAIALLAAGRAEESAATFDESATGAKPGRGLAAFRAAAYQDSGRVGDAAAARATLLAEEPGFSVAGFGLLRPFTASDRARMAASMVRAGLPE